MFNGWIQFCANFRFVFVWFILHEPINCSIFSGCSQAIILAPSMTLLGQYFDKRRGLANCIAQAGASAGSLVFPVLIRALLNTYSLHGTLLFVGAMNLHMLVSGSLLRPLSFYKKKVVKDKRVINENGHIRHEELPIRTQNTLKDKIENVTVLLDKNGVTIHKTEDKNLNIIIEQENKYIKFDGSIDTKLSQYSKTSEQLNGNHATNISNGIAKNHQVISNNTVNDLKHTYRSATEVREPLLYYSPTVARAILGRKSKERYYPELGSSSTLGAFVAGMSTSSIGRYASSELSVSSALDLRDKDTISHHKQDNTDDKPTETTLCCIQRTPGSSSVFDCSVLKRLPFWFFLPTACLLCSSCSMVLVFLPPHARDKGLTDSEITVLMSTIGGIDVVALLVWGVIADCGCMKRYQLVMVAALIFGVAIHLSPLYDNFSSFMAVSVVVGLIGRVYFSLYPVLLVDFLGLEYLRSALGLTIMAQTCFVAFIVPLIGKYTETIKLCPLDVYLCQFLMYDSNFYITNCYHLETLCT